MTTRWVVRDGFGLDHLAQVPYGPRDPGPGEVALRMVAWSLNHRDLLMVQGVYDPRIPLPFVPLSDGVGVVTALGAGVTRHSVGDRVCATFSPGWRDGTPGPNQFRQTRGGAAVPGVLAEHVVLDEEELVRVPDTLTDVEAATLPCAGLTAWSALSLAEIAPGQTVLVQGTGGVALFAVQLARLRGAVVAAVTSSLEKADRLQALGVTHVLDYTAVPDWGKAMRRWSGDGVDLVIDVGGGGTLAQSIAATASGGMVAIIGNLASNEDVVNVLPILMRQIRCQGVFAGHRRGLQALVGALAVHPVKPVVHAVYPYDQVPAAFATLAAKTHIGKICVAAGE